MNETVEPGDNSVLQFASEETQAPPSKPAPPVSPKAREREIFLSHGPPAWRDSPAGDSLHGATRQSVSAAPARRATRAILLGTTLAVGLAAAFAGGFLLGRGDTPAVQLPAVQLPEVQQERSAAPDLQAAETPPPPQDSSLESGQETIDTAPAAPGDAPNGRILVRSIPPGAAVTLDGEFRGTTPLALRDLTLGDRTIEIAHTDHDTRQVIATLTAERPTRSLDVELHPTGTPGPAYAAGTRSGALYVLSRPSGARLFVDDDPVGTAPLLLSGLSAGSHRVRLELQGYRTWSGSIQIEPNQRFRIAVSLEP